MDLTGRRFGHVLPVTICLQPERLCRDECAALYDRFSAAVTLFCRRTDNSRPPDLETSAALTAQNLLSIVLPKERSVRWRRSDCNAPTHRFQYRC
ncbi:hypothetical protein F2P81_010688 [Scophthalmus maximus]|uniref:Uncharacterized protein n=1 Tax=Scophthalmus maximus TaxID=52904 RepID=A0A6A4T3K7_SCOMX|nr:hypothetical protein F2P81_010688 [Scophthalmus maximus]